MFNANSAIFQQYHGNDEVRFVLDQQAELDFYSASSLKQQSADKHVAPLGHIILILSQPVFALNRIWPVRRSNPGSTALEASTLTIMPPMQFPRPLEIGLGLLKFSDSSPVVYWNIKYFMVKVSCWPWAPNKFCLATKIVILASSTGNCGKVAKFVPAMKMWPHNYYINVSIFTMVLVFTGLLNLIKIRSPYLLPIFYQLFCSRRIHMVYHLLSNQKNKYKQLNNYNAIIKIIVKLKWLLSKMTEMRGGIMVLIV